MRAILFLLLGCASCFAQFPFSGASWSVTPAASASVQTPTMVQALSMSSTMDLGPANNTAVWLTAGECH